MQIVRPWLSSASIDAGSRWSPEVARALEEMQFGIVCITPENIAAPWILYEAGALSKAVNESRVVPYLLGIEPHQLQGPLAQFQASRADESGTLQLVSALNTTATDRGVPQDVLDETFAMWWPQLSKGLASVRASAPAQLPVVTRPVDEMIAEALDLLRAQSRVVVQQEPSLAFPSTDLLAIGERVRNLRVKHGLTQSELGLVANLSPGYISQIENGRVRLGLYALLNLAKALEVSTRELETGQRPDPAG
jgi:DNA-binding XRE family transcriptional regulator